MTSWCVCVAQGDRVIDVGSEYEKSGTDPLRVVQLR